MIQCPCTAPHAMPAAAFTAAAATACLAGTARLHITVKALLSLVLHATPSYITVSQGLGVPKPLRMLCMCFAQALSTKFVTDMPCQHC